MVVLVMLHLLELSRHARANRKPAAQTPCLACGVVTYSFHPSKSRLIGWGLSSSMSKLECAF